MTSECTEVHTRIMRLALAVDDARAYWAHVDPAVPPAQRALLAFEERWFGPKSHYRVKNLLANFSVRFDAFPEGLEVLRKWRSMEPQTRALVCHWHLQLADPLYRDFTGRFLVNRRESLRPEVTRDVVVEWLRQHHPGRWRAVSEQQIAGKLLSAAHEAGLVSSNRDPRPLVFPRVPDPALSYLLRLLGTVTFAGSLLENPYLASVGLTGGFLGDRLRTLPGLTYRRMGELSELMWAQPGLVAFAEGAP